MNEPLVKDQAVSYLYVISSAKDRAVSYHHVTRVVKAKYEVQVTEGHTHAQTLVI